MGEPGDREHEKTVRELWIFKEIQMSKLYYDPSLPEEVALELSNNEPQTPRTDHEQSCDIKLAENDLVRGEFARKLEIELGEQWKSRINCLTFHEYQEKSRLTAIYPRMGENLEYPTLGLCGESGEVAEKVKKILRDDGGKCTCEKKEELKKELGDVLWYISNIASELGLDLDDIAKNNIEKLASRKARNKIQGSGDDR